MYLREMGARRLIASAAGEAPRRRRNLRRKLDRVARELSELAEYVEYWEPETEGLGWKSWLLRRGGLALRDPSEQSDESFELPATLVPDAAEFRAMADMFRAIDLPSAEELEEARRKFPPMRRAQVEQVLTKWLTAYLRQVCHFSKRENDRRIVWIGHALWGSSHTEETIRSRRRRS